MKYWRPTIATGIAAALIFFLILVGDLGVLSLFDRMKELGAWWILIIAASFVQIALSAEKWRIVLVAIGGENIKEIQRRFFIATTAIAAVSSQFLTVYAASIVVRSVAGHVHNLRTSTSAGSSGFEQLFDVAVLFVFFVPTVATLLLLEGLQFWVVLAVLSLAAAVVGITLVTKWMRHRKEYDVEEQSGAAHYVVSRLKLSVDREKQNAVASKAQLLFSLSVIRYVAMFTRAAVVAAAAGYVFDARNLILAFNAAQASQLASLTPGNIGISEWSWAGVLGYLGDPFNAAIEFAILLRVCTFVSLVIIMTIVVLLYLRQFSDAWRRRRYHQDCTD